MAKIKGRLSINVVVGVAIVATVIILAIYEWSYWNDTSDQWMQAPIQINAQSKSAQPIDDLKANKN